MAAKILKKVVGTILLTIIFTMVTVVAIIVVMANIIYEGIIKLEKWANQN